MFTTPLSEVLRMVRKNSKNRRFTDAAKKPKIGGFAVILNTVNNVYYSAFGGFADGMQKLKKSEVLRSF